MCIRDRLQVGVQVMLFPATEAGRPDVVGPATAVTIPEAAVTLADAVYFAAPGSGITLSPRVVEPDAADKEAPLSAVKEPPLSLQ